MLKSLEIIVKLQEELNEERRLGLKISNIPEEIDSLDEELKKYKADLHGVEERYNAVLSERVVLEQELDLKEEKKKKLQDQLMNVKDNVQYKATLEEISFIGKDMEQMEEKILLNLEEEDELIEKKKMAKRTLDENKEKVSSRKEELQKRKKEMEAEMAKIKATIKDYREQVDPELLERYDALLPKKQGIGIAGVKDDGICAACHFKIRPQVFAELVADSGIQVCDNCRRLLYYLPPEVEEEE